MRRMRSVGSTGRLWHDGPSMQSSIPSCQAPGGYWPTRSRARKIHLFLSSAFRLGLVRPDQLGLLAQAGHRSTSNCWTVRAIALATQPITSLDQHDWVIRASLVGNDLSHAERDLLAARLHASLDALSASPYEVLHTALLATQLLAAIDRPVDPAQYRVRVHDWLRKSHTTQGGGFEPGGGFKTYLNLSVGSPASHVRRGRTDGDLRRSRAPEAQLGALLSASAAAQDRESEMDRRRHTRSPEPIAWRAAANCVRSVVLRTQPACGRGAGWTLYLRGGILAHTWRRWRLDGKTQADSLLYNGPI